MTTLGDILIAGLVIALLVLVGRAVWMHWITKPQKAWEAFNKRHANPPAWLRNGEEERGPHGTYDDTRP